MEYLEITDIRNFMRLLAAVGPPAWRKSCNSIAADCEQALAGKPPQVHLVYATLEEAAEAEKRIVRNLLALRDELRGDKAEPPKGQEFKDEGDENGNPE